MRKKKVAVVGAGALATAVASAVAAKAEEFTLEQVREVPCIICDAIAGEHCMTNYSGRRVVMVECHPERSELRKKCPNLSFVQGLDATDKSLIVYYAFVMLCDSLQPKSLEIIGKHFTSRELQVFFAKMAIAELRKDGLLA